jgi:hypothetical protein
MLNAFIIQEMPTSPTSNSVNPKDTDVDPSDPNLTIPLVRYNAMLAVLRNTLYMSVTFVLLENGSLNSHRYGGIYERGAREYTLDDFYSLQLDKLDRFVCLKESGIVPVEGENDESEDEDESHGDEDSSSDDESSNGEEASEDSEEEGMSTNKKPEVFEDEDAPLKSKVLCSNTGYHIKN